MEKGGDEGFAEGGLGAVYSPKIEVEFMPQFLPKRRF